MATLSEVFAATRDNTLKERIQAATWVEAAALAVTGTGPQKSYAKKHLKILVDSDEMLQMVISVAVAAVDAKAPTDSEIKAQVRLVLIDNAG